MLSQRLKYLILMTVTIVTLVACGGGGTQVAGGGIGGTGISQGSITQFGSVWVNGVEFDTTNSSIVKDGVTYHPTSLAELKNVLSVGMIVSVDGTINSDGVSGTADSVSYSKELLGPISQKPNNNSLIVLGQTIIVDDLTKIVLINGSTGTINDLNLNDTVEISGFLTANGIRASFIEQKSPTSDVELRGVVAAINGSIITIGTQEIDISAVPSYTPTKGDFIEVQATVTMPGPPLQAISVEKKSRGLGTGSSDQAEFEGFVTSVNSSSDFMVDGQEVQTTTQTIFSGGTASDITKGTRLEINGALSNGILVASRIRFEDQLSLEGNITSYDKINNTIMLDSYPGVPIQINDVLTEGATTPLDIGYHVRIRGRQPESNCTSSSCVLATELDHVTSGGGGATATESHVIIDTFDVQNQTITTTLGTVVDVSGIQHFGGQDSAGHDITNITEFFAAIKVGDVVDLKGTNTNGTVTWDSIDLED